MSKIEKQLYDLKMKILIDESINDTTKRQLANDIFDISTDVLRSVSNSAFVEMLQKQQNKICSCCGDLEKAGWKECGCDQEGFNRGIEKAIEMFIKHYC